MNKYLLAGEETERLLFRKAVSSDSEAWLEFYKDPATSAHWTNESMLPEDACRLWLDTQFYRYQNDKWARDC